MSHPLVETAAWAPTVTVPDAGDSGATRHTALEVPAQALTNRTAYLKGLAEGALAKAGGTITGNLTVTGNITTNSDLIVTDDITADDITCQNLTATANVTCSEINAGEGSIGQLGATVATITGTIGAGGSITTSQNLRLPGGWRVVYTGDAASRRRTKRVNLAGATSSVATSSLIFGGSNWQSVASGYVLSVPLPPLANLTEIEEVRVRYFASGADGSISLIRQTITDWTDGGATPSATTIATEPITAGAGVKTATITLGTPEVIDNASRAYWIRVNGDASASHTIYGAALVVLMYSPGID